MITVGPSTAAVLGAGASLAGTAVYLRDVRRGDTRPHRGTWFVWTVVGVLAATSHGAEGGRWSLLVVWVQALTTLAVLVAAVPRGVGTLTTGNSVLLLVAAVGVGGWLTFDDPLAATVSVVVADGSALLAMLPKSWHDPHSEGVTLYALAALTGVLAAVAVGSGTFGLLLFPVYMGSANLCFAGFLLWRRSVLRGPAPARHALAP